jgi:hypothetical protein
MSRLAPSAWNKRSTSWKCNRIGIKLRGALASHVYTATNEIQRTLIAGLLGSRISVRNRAKSPAGGESEAWHLLLGSTPY